MLARRHQFSAALASSVCESILVKIAFAGNYQLSLQLLDELHLVQALRDNELRLSPSALALTLGKGRRSLVWNQGEAARLKALG